MNFLEALKSLDDEQIEKKVKEKIKRLERQSRKDAPNVKVLGYLIELTPEKREVFGAPNDRKLAIDMQSFYNCFIPKDMKIVFGISYNAAGMIYNRGKYYYADDQDILVEFCKWVKDKDIISDYELFGYMRDFLKLYFGQIPQVDRYTMYSVIHDQDGNPFPPTKEHSMKSFKGKGNAECTEYSVMAQNLLRLFGYHSYIFMGNESLSTGKSGTPHAFNMISFQECDTKEIKHMVIDFTIPVDVYDIHNKKLGEEPFYGTIDHIDQELVDKIIYEDEKLVFDDYAYIFVGDIPAKAAYERQRTYYVDKRVVPMKRVK